MFFEVYLDLYSIFISINRNISTSFFMFCPYIFKFIKLGKEIKKMLPNGNLVTSTKIIKLIRPHQIKVFGICVGSNFILELKSTSGLLPVLRILVSVQWVIILVLFFFLIFIFRTIHCECLRNHCNAFPRTPVCQLDRAPSFANTLKVMQNICLLFKKLFSNIKDLIKLSQCSSIWWIRSKIYNWSLLFYLVKLPSMLKLSVLAIHVLVSVFSFMLLII